MKSIQEIKEEFKMPLKKNFRPFAGPYQEDGRKGVQKLIEQAEKKTGKASG